ncbi:DUF5691 domain-containing protein [Humibacillus xanthopallidus]|uniref:Uncharacterized protein n=1 Tax=Humibacillus xanthopallidus TaxID=412689 RepID=A0A543I335_9MICO|nr:DUF5691 domain-containing protein [Humibacillus xanthopallidus]TQM64985.1 hypothetical protein FBY41_1367 [Humibacillus xanthopallidus]
MSDQEAGDVDTWWREVGNVALVGTSRRPVPPLPDLGPAGVRARADGARREETLLDSVAIGAAALRAGRRLDHADPPAAAPDDHRPVAPRRAVQLLELVITQPPAGAQQRAGLLVHWLRAADDAGCRVPHGLLPGLLDLATGGRELRRPVTAVLDERGRWLAGLREEWSWVADAVAGAGAGAASRSEGTAPAAGDWARLPSSDRIAVLATLRTHEPAAARALVASTWATDSARDRHAHLGTLRIGLGPDDEPLLEAALDDRAATVRGAAAELLDAFPGSARAARMAERLRPLVRRTGLLGRGVEVTLPGEPDPAGTRDGLGKPPPRRSARGWWLEQICAGAPLEVWSELTGADPSLTVKRLTDAQATDALTGIRRAVRARRDPEWATALLDRGWDPTLVAALPRERRERVVLTRVDATTDRVHELGAVVGSVDPPWSPDFSVALVSRLRASKVGSAMVLATMPHLLSGLHPAALDPLERWIEQAGGDQTLTTNLRNLLQFHSVKRSITEAFR